MQITLQEPQTPEDFEKYFELRWRILRKPWGEPKGSEQDEQENNAYHIMAVTDNKVVGVARLQFPEQATAQLRYMAVDDEYQGKGIGRAIIEHMEQCAKSNSAKELFFNARDNALGFYEKLGYHFIAKTYLLFGTIQHYKMSKKL